MEAMSGPSFFSLACAIPLCSQLPPAFTIDALQPGYLHMGPSSVNNANFGMPGSNADIVRLPPVSIFFTYRQSSWFKYLFNCTRTLTPSTCTLLSGKCHTTH
ncbi:hypothetical protein EDB92DRAFT_1831920 [Lactarius akahatsu]|uniref:Uncharacterized protein n=1 Tax=Lactarius akahatsu TaxID=416441 RepID=A0AAD4LU53_9AGAM|nr:hypothetical protein EDB92DRAFT_1831920 [Lactarius akahatsu]